VVPSAANITFYAQIVREASVRRRLLRIATEISADAYNDKNNSRVIIEEAERRIFEIADNQQTGSYVSAGSIVNETVDSIEKAFHNQGDYRGVPSGFMDLDALLSGFQKSEFVIIGARPSVGKTALALCMAAHISGISKGRREKPVGFFSLEMSRMAIMQRLVSSEGRINSIAIRTGNLKAQDFSSLTAAAGRIYEAPLFLSDTPNMKILDLRSQARRMRSKENVEIVFVDYLGLIQSERPELPRWEQISEISRSMKALARELDIPVVALAQVGRQTDKKDTPDLADLRDSGSIEQDADVVMFLYRDKEKKGSQDGGGANSIEEIHLKVAKNRNGPTGGVRLVFLRNYARFESSTGKSLE
jgi:replicative DNA helicase